MTQWDRCFIYSTMTFHVGVGWTAERHQWGATQSLDSAVDCLCSAGSVRTSWESAGLLWDNSKVVHSLNPSEYDSAGPARCAWNIWRRRVKYTVKYLKSVVWQWQGRNVWQMSSHTLTGQMFEELPLCIIHHKIKRLDAVPEGQGEACRTSVTFSDQEGAICSPSLCAVFMDQPLSNLSALLHVTVKPWHWQVQVLVLRQTRTTHTLCLWIHYNAQPITHCKYL